MADLFSVLGPLAGTIVGGAISAGTTAWLDSRRFARERMALIEDREHERDARRRLLQRDTALSLTADLAGASMLATTLAAVRGLEHAETAKSMASMQCWVALDDVRRLIGLLDDERAAQAGNDFLSAMEKVLKNESVDINAPLAVARSELSAYLQRLRA